MKQLSYKLRIPNDVTEFVRKMHPTLKKKIKASLQIILSDSSAGKALKDELQELRSFRVGKFRIVYRISSGRIIEIIAIGPRKRIYEETFLILKKEGIKKD
ncbi:MAG: type II toxin-antitoxin system RelE/ParE family toxin [Nitrospirota bacterium]